MACWREGEALWDEIIRSSSESNRDEAESNRDEDFHEVPLQYKPQLELWADELSVCHAKIVCFLVRHTGMSDEDRNPIAGCLCDCVVAITLIDDELLRDEEDIKLDAYLSCVTAYRKLEAARAALSLPEGFVI